MSGPFIRGRCRGLSEVNGRKDVRVEPINLGDRVQPKPTRHRRPPAADITPETPIWCPECQQEHPASAFNKESRKYSGLHGVCREAQRCARKTPEGVAKTAERNKRRWADPEYRSRSRTWQRGRRVRLGTNHDLARARKRLQSIVQEWKAKGCVDCGYVDIRAIDPDHLDRETKLGHVSRMVQMCASERRIRDELAKCVPRCARCHREVTRRQRPSAMRAAETLPPSWRRLIEFQDRNDRFKLALGCVDCGWRGWARGLDWDHVRGEKHSSIATLINRIRPWTEIVVEMTKCECVCANCHRIRTIERLRVKSREAAERRPSTAIATVGS